MAADLPEPQQQADDTASAAAATSAASNPGGDVTKAEAGGDSNSNGNIEIYLRVRPVKSPSERMSTDPTEGQVRFSIPREATAGFINNTRERYDFRFNGIFAPDAKQDEVFERVARKVVVSALDGINGTLSSRSDSLYALHVSYLEIYNETGYDLLVDERGAKGLEDMPKVTLMEDEEHRIHLKNLSAHRCMTEEEALNLLFLGDTNRMISETPMNLASSRSHCIFTARKAGSEVVRRSKLHIVDLAGSERTAKTQVAGTTLKEATYINLSLHYLEQVIIALQERAQGLARSHVPYRNSVLTSVIRDSLGGNCKTVMIATVNQSQDQLDESISTCRFAQRVACVSNEAYVNEELDPALEEVRLLRGEQEDRGPLTEGEIDNLRTKIEAYIADDAADASLPLGGQMLFIRAAHGVFKRMVLEARRGVKGMSAGGGGGGVNVLDKLKKLQLQVQQRDNEISILVSMLNSKNSSDHPSQQAGPKPGLGPSSNSGPGLVVPPSLAPPGPRIGQASGCDLIANGTTDALVDASLLADRNKAFEMFRKSYRKNEAIEENKTTLKSKYDEAKQLGENINKSREASTLIRHHRFIVLISINALKRRVEQRRMARSVSLISTAPRTLRGRIWRRRA
eukprot:jgi/Chlat1/1778/Chrsp134S02115